MGTRGLLGFIIRGKKRGFYQHFDSYHSGLGAVLVLFILLLREDQYDVMAEKLAAIRWVDEDAMTTQEEADQMRVAGLATKPEPRYSRLPEDNDGIGPMSWRSATWFGQMGVILPLILSGAVTTLPDSVEFAKDGVFCENTYWLDFERRLFINARNPDNVRGRCFGFEQLRNDRAGYWHKQAVLRFIQEEKGCLGRGVYSRNVETAERCEGMIMQALVDQDVEVLEEDGIGRMIRKTYWVGKVADAVKMAGGVKAVGGADGSDVDRCAPASGIDSAEGGRTNSIFVDIPPLRPYRTAEDRESWREMFKSEERLTERMLRVDIAKIRLLPRSSDGAQVELAPLLPGYSRIAVPETVERLVQGLGMTEAEMDRDWVLHRFSTLVSDAVGDDVERIDSHNARYEVWGPDEGVAPNDRWRAQMGVTPREMRRTEEEVAATQKQVEEARGPSEKWGSLAQLVNCDIINPALGREEHLRLLSIEPLAKSNYFRSYLNEAFHNKEGMMKTDPHPYDAR